MNNRWKSYQIVSGILAVVWMGVIFGFSAQPSDLSGEVSGGLSFQIVSTADRLFGLQFELTKILEIAQQMEGILRKLAHMTEYAVLAILLSLFLDHFNNHAFLITCKLWAAGTNLRVKNFIFHTMLRKRLQYGLALGIAACYAASDEYHQLFVYGRSGSIRDVLIDTAGGVIGIAVLLGVRACISFLHKRQYPDRNRSD